MHGRIIRARAAPTVVITTRVRTCTQDKIAYARAEMLLLYCIAIVSVLLAGGYGLPNMVCVSPSLSPSLPLSTPPSLEGICCYTEYSKLDIMLIDFCYPVHIDIY